MKNILSVSYLILICCTIEAYSQESTPDKSIPDYYDSIIDVYYSQYNISESALFQKDDFSFVKFEIFSGVEGGWNINKRLSVSGGVENFKPYNLANSYFVKSKYGLVTGDLFNIATVGVVAKGLSDNSLFAMGQVVSTYGDQNTNFSLGISGALDRNGKEHLFLHFAGTFRTGSVSFITDNVVDVDLKIVSSLMMRIISKNIIFDLGVNSDLQGDLVPILSAGLSL